MRRAGKTCQQAVIYEMLSGRSVTHIADEKLTKLVSMVNATRPICLLLDALAPQPGTTPDAIGGTACWCIEPTPFDPKESDPPIIVAGRLGHSISTLLANYAHFIPTMKDAAACDPLRKGRFK